MITLVVNPGSFWLTAAKLGRAKRRFKFVENWKKGFGNGNLARERALNEELRMMNEEWQRNSPPSGRRSTRRGRW